MNERPRITPQEPEGIVIDTVEKFKELIADMDINNLPPSRPGILMGSFMPCVMFEHKGQKYTVHIQAAKEFKLTPEYKEMNK